MPVMAAKIIARGNAATACQVVTEGSTVFTPPGRSSLPARTILLLASTAVTIFVARAAAAAAVTLLRVLTTRTFPAGVVLTIPRQIRTLGGDRMRSAVDATVARVRWQSGRRHRRGSSPRRDRAGRFQLGSGLDCETYAPRPQPYRNSPVAILFSVTLSHACISNTLPPIVFIGAERLREREREMA